jgi:hypothetical protein
LAALTTMDSVKPGLPSLNLRAMYTKFLAVWVRDLGT